MNKQALIVALRAFVNQRPGLEYGNYGDPVAYRAEMRSITKSRKDALALLASVAWRDSITAEKIIEAAKHAYSGRLTITPKGEGFELDYCTGQYWPTEYRNAVCAVLSGALWSYFRDNMPAPVGMVKRTSGVGTFRTEYEIEAYPFAGKKVSAGDYLRMTAKRELGNVGARWFN